MRKIEKIEEKVYIYNADDLKSEQDVSFAYDAFCFITSLQGLLNREKPVLFINYRDGLDSFWLEYISGNGKMLNGKTLVRLTSYIELLKIFAAYIKECGLAVWDLSVPSTLNVAVTICGVNGCLPVCEGRFYNLLCEMTDSEIRIDLRNKFNGKSPIFGTCRQSTGSAKCDAYIYALENYFNQTSDNIMGYILDGAGRQWLHENSSRDYENVFIPNIDYLVAERAFVFDLCPWDDEPPCDDTAQPVGADFAVFKEILSRQTEKNCGQKITSVTGFTPWQAKYTRHGDKSVHGEVETEWRHAELLSAYNCIMDADAYGYCGLFNASLYRLYPLKDKYINSHTQDARRLRYDKDKTYILLYMGDYDSAVWLTIYAPVHWNDPNRGVYPSMWCFNPNLSKRVPMVFDYLYENKSENDFFAAGDSGAGYLNPSLLFSPRIFSKLPAADELFIHHNKYYFNKFDLSDVGFIINGHHKLDERVFDMYAKFISNGAGHNGYGMPVYIKDGIIFMGHMSDLPGISIPTQKFNEGKYNPEDIDRAADMVISFNKEKRYVNFMIFRTILWTPSMVAELAERLKEKDAENEYIFANPEDFFRMAKEEL